MGEMGGPSFQLPKGGASLRRSMPIHLESWKYGSTAPTTSTSGTSPAVTGLLFDSTSDSILIQFALPLDYAGQDIELHLGCVNTASETVGDVIEWTFDYIVLVGQSKLRGGVYYTGNTTSKTNSQVTSSTPVFGAITVGAGQIWECILTLPQVKDATNDLKPGAEPVYLFGELSRGSHGGAGEVGDVLLVESHVEYTALSDLRIG